MSDLWQWNLDAAYPYLSTSLLESWPHGFFTRHSWPTAPNDLSQQLDMAAAMYRAKQVHGNRVLVPTDFPSDETKAADRLPEADAVMTLTPRQAAWVCTADCTPILIADGRTGQVAAIHAGWRGTALRIVPATVQQLQAHGSDVANLRVAMGPAIAGEVYQVTTQVAAAVGRSLSLSSEPEPDESLLSRLQAMEHPPVLPDEQPGRLRLDVRRINVLQLLALGIAANHIAIAPHCTFQEPERFFSYRRTREKKVQWSGIVSR
jgi:YfiH family protein